jgi:hypothetical protein
MPREDRAAPLGERQTERPSQGAFVEAPRQDFSDVVRGFGWRGGRGHGKCGGAQGRKAGKYRGLGFGDSNTGGGGGFGCAGRIPAEISPDQEILVLQERAEYLRHAQEEIERRIEELKAACKE